MWQFSVVDLNMSFEVMAVIFFGLYPIHPGSTWSLNVKQPASMLSFCSLDVKTEREYREETGQKMTFLSAGFCNSMVIVVTVGSESTRSTKGLRVFIYKTTSLLRNHVM